MLIAMPLLTVWADLFGILGGMVMAKNILNIPYIAFINRFPTDVTLTTFLIGMIKAPVFAFIIAAVGCFQGFQVSGSAESIGLQTTKKCRAVHFSYYSCRCNIFDCFILVKHMNHIIPINQEQPIITIQGLSTYLGDRDIHKDLDLEVYPNEILAIVGGSGSGKTTLLRAILMLQPIVTGSIKVLDQELVNCGPKVEQFIQRSWGVLFQSSALFSSLTVLENVSFPLHEQTHLASKDIAEIARLKLNLVGLPLDSADKYPAELSGGMQKTGRTCAIDRFGSTITVFR